MELHKNEVHIWSFPLHLTTDDMKLARSILNTDECARADRFHFDIKRERFIAAHSTLRKILALYLAIDPNVIAYDYTKHQKPSLKPAFNSLIQFNLTHSDELGACAITLNQQVGIDIERIEHVTKEDLAKRYFSSAEYNALMVLQSQSRIDLFYAIWTRKEAVLKATGKGLTIPLNQFTVPLTDQCDRIELDGNAWTIYPLHLHPHYGSALAIAGSVKKMSYWTWHENKPMLVKEDVI